MEYVIKIPDNIEIYVEDQKIYFKGYYGTEFLNFSPFKLQILKNELKILNINSKTLILCQTFITLIQQSIKGVLVGYKKQLQLVGVGFRCKIINDKLELKLGFSHLIYEKIPDNLKIECVKSNKIVVKGTNKQQVNEFASFLQSLKFPEPYKGKGIFFKNQKIIRKQGKKV